MFTGLIEEVGIISRLQQVGDRYDLEIDARRVTEDVGIDDSVAVNGICLTVVEFNSQGFRVQVIPQTLRMTSLRNYRTGDKVNLERSMSAQDRFGGHFVQGHVDGVATVIAIDQKDDHAEMLFDIPEHLAKYCVNQGSIALDGISLTIASLKEQHLRVGLIPHTMKQTNLGERTPGDPVNIEVDILSKYVERHLHPDEQSGMSMEWLSEQGIE